MKKKELALSWSKGFTLIELLVVIAILAGLVVILFPNFMEARARARDAQRKSDLKSIQKALELYRVNHYPPSYPPDGFIIATTCQTWSESGITYMSKFPQDPLGNCASGMKPYYYHNYTIQGDSLRYDLYSCLENTIDPDAVVGPDNPYNFAAMTNNLYSCPVIGGTTKYYKLTQP